MIGKSHFVVLIMFLFMGKLFAQNSLFRKELPKDYMLWDVKIVDKPMQSVKYSGFCIAWHKTENSLILYGITGVEQIIFLEKFVPQFRFNGNSFSKLEFQNGVLKLCSKTTKSEEEVCGQFSWDGKRLQFEKEVSFDPNMQILKRAKDLKASMKLKEAILAFDSISYATTYYNPEQEGIELLNLAFEQSKQLSEKNKFKDAADLYKRTFGFGGMKSIVELKNQKELTLKFGKKLHGITSQSYLEIVLDYLNTLMKARMFDDFIAVNGKFLLLFQDASEIYLRRGDAYFAKKDKPKYVENYNKYVQLMKEKKKEKSIEDYVLGRLK